MNILNTICYICTFFFFIIIIVLKTSDDVHRTKNRVAPDMEVLIQKGRPDTTFIYTFKRK
jgi:hypothetical protein